ncbi:MAG: aspartate aminotransferase family protein [Proteobacteria bacterium]|nr:aspartate aminotransferase family protein [Pseudomonadota bacterium]
MVDTLARHECPAITARRSRRATALGAANDDPLVWQEACGANVRDADGNVFVDLTSGFGVAFVGHRHPEIVEAAKQQSNHLIHALGDSSPDVTRIALLQLLGQYCPGELSVSILGLSGSDAVDAAVKTAVLATGRHGIVTFDGSYHGLSLGIVALQAYKSAFVAPFKEITHPRVYQLPWGCEPQKVEDLVRSNEVGLVLAEPIQGRGGMRPPPTGWLAQVSEATKVNGAVFALDEIQTGFGRTGSWFACNQEDLVPDLICVGKALGGGYPISACVGRREVMDCWGASTGEALHTQTFLGHPIGCATAIAVINLLARDKLPQRAADVGNTLANALTERGFSLRGRGLMQAVIIDDALAISRRLLQKGFLALPAGKNGEVLGLTPPVCLTEAQIQAFADTMAEVT